MSEQAAQKIPGFMLTGVLGEGATSVVYRGTRGGSAYAVKVMRRAGDQARQTEAVVRFRREAAAIARLNHPRLVRVLEVDEHDGVPYLVMELVEGVGLAERLAKGPLKDDELLEVARSLAAGVAEVHRRGLVHRDLKPANVIVEPSGKAKIIDFGFVARAEDDRESGGGVVVGTFLYSAPEQTGMLKRPVDGRADLYALGAVLYECASGKPPFQSDSVADLLQKHLTIRPKPLENVRPAFAEIVAKLLAKDPDDRYQTGEALLADLENVQSLDEAIRRGNEVRLGARDATLRAFAEVPLVGRTEEIAALTTAWERAKSGRGSIVQIEGEGGSGKTRLVRELVARVRSAGGAVLSAKAQQVERAPFTVFRAAIDDLVASVQRDEVARERVFRAIREAAGDFGAIVRRLTPSLDRVLEDAPQLRTLEPAVEQERFYDKVAEFFCELARRLGPTVLVVDDVQWLDEGSAGLLRQIDRDIDGAPLLVATTARNDRASAAAVEQLVESLSLQRISLGPLDTAAVGELLAAHLGGKRLDQEVVTRLAETANGNPFAVVEYLRSLLDRGMLRPAADRWVVDTTRFHELALPKDVIQLLLDRIATLSADAARTLRVAAVVGLEFDEPLLEQATSGTPERVARALGEALRANLIERTDRGYRIVHDRVHEALREGLASDARRAAHDAIARALEARNDERDVFAIARHYVEGDARAHPEKVYETCLRAGRRALATFANELALEFLERAREHAPSDERELTELLGTACLRTGRLPEAQQQLGAALATAKDDAQRQRLLTLVTQTYAAQGDNERAWQELQETLALLDADFPKSKPGQALTMIWYWVFALIRARTGAGFGAAKGDTRKLRLARSEVHRIGNFLAYFIGDPFLMAQCIMRELHNAQFLGTCIETAKAHNWYGIICGLFGRAASVERHFAIAMNMSKQLGDAEALAYTTSYYGHGVEFAGDNVRGQRIVIDNLPDARKYCSAWDWSGAMAHIGMSMVFQGRAADSVAWFEEQLPAIKSGNCANFVAAAYGGLYSQYTLLGRAEEAAAARKEQAALAATMPTVKFVQAFYRANEILALVEQDDLGDELEEHIKAFLALNADDYHFRYAFLSIAWARLEQHRRAPSATTLKALAGAIDRCGFPPPLTQAPVHRCHIFALQAALAREKGSLDKSGKLLERAEALAKKSESVWGAYVVERERARLAKKRGDADGEQRHAEAALAVASNDGLRHRVREIRKEFGVERAPQSDILGRSSPASLRSPAGSEARTRREVALERYVDALLQVSLASSSSLDATEQARATLDAIVKVLGAERAALFSDSLSLVAGRLAGGRDLGELTGYSTTVVKKVAESRKPLVVTGTDEGEALGSESAVAHGLRSIMAAPITIRDRFLGVVYLDSTLAKGLFTEDDLGILNALCNHIGIAIETARAARIEADRKELERDLALTAAVQTMFLPKKTASGTGRISLAGHYEPANRCSGDWWWYDARPNELRVLVGDVTGHGAASAMLTASTATICRMIHKAAPNNPLDKMLAALHAELSEVAGGDYRMTMAGVVINERSRTLNYWSAGAPPIFVLRTDGKVDALSAPGTPLGSAGSFTLGTRARALSPGERVFVFTDGAFEIETSNGRQLGLRRLSAMLAATKGMSDEEASAAIAKQLKHVGEGRPLADDITYVVISIA